MQKSMLTFFFLLCSLLRGMDHSHLFLKNACEEARKNIPTILMAPLRNNPLNGPIICSSQSALSEFCTSVENLLLREPLCETFIEEHQRLKNLVPVPTYETYSLYKIYRSALENFYEEKRMMRQKNYREAVANYILTQRKKTLKS